MKQKKTLLKTNFFAQFEPLTIFNVWNESTTFLELAIKLGLTPNSHLKRIDYEYIETIKNKQNWKQINSHTKSRQRYNFILNLSFEELHFTMNLNAIETLSHLALHYLVSPKHGRKILRKRNAYWI